MDVVIGTTYIFPTRFMRSVLNTCIEMISSKFELFEINYATLKSSTVFPLLISISAGT